MTTGTILLGFVIAIDALGLGFFIIMAASRRAREAFSDWLDRREDTGAWPYG